MISLPPGTKGPLTVRAQLNYWPFSPALLKQLMGDAAIKTEPVEMVVTEGTIDVISRRDDVARATPTATHSLRQPGGRDARLGQ